MLSASRLGSSVLAPLFVFLLLMTAWVGLSPQAAAFQASPPTSGTWAVGGQGAATQEIIQAGGAGGSVNVANTSTNPVIVSYTDVNGNAVDYELAGNNTTEITIKAKTPVTLKAKSNGVGGTFASSGTWARV